MKIRGPINYNYNYSRQELKGLVDIQLSSLQANVDLTS